MDLTLFEEWWYSQPIGMQNPASKSACQRGWDAAIRHGEAEQPPPSDALEFIEESRLHKLERDAERYRWIRMNRKGALISIWIGHKDGPKDFDAAIDTCVLSSRSLQQEEK